MKSKVVEAILGSTSDTSIQSDKKDIISEIFGLTDQEKNDLYITNEEPEVEQIKSKD